jgi:hypothetical protein
MTGMIGIVVPWAIASVVFSAVTVALVLSARMTRALHSGDEPSDWRPHASFSGAVTLGRLFMNLPGTARLEISPQHALLRPVGPPWFHAIWVDRSRVVAVYAGPWHSAVGGGIRFKSDDDRLDRIGFWPSGGGLTNGRDRVLAELRNLGWPVESP